MRLSGPDIAGLLLCAEHYAAPYDLLTAALDVQPPRWTCSRRACVGSWPAGGPPTTPGPARLAPARHGAG
ncbi:MAG TPA: hypothetical protein VF482_07550 [Trebonia sp.]